MIENNKPLNRKKCTFEASPSLGCCILPEGHSHAHLCVYEVEKGFDNGIDLAFVDKDGAINSGLGSELSMRLLRNGIIFLR